MALGLVFNAGSRVTGTQLQSIVTQVDVLTAWAPLNAYKTSATARNSTTTPAADPDLTITLPASTTWDFDALLLVTSAANAAGDLMFQFTYPTGATLSHGGWALHNTLASGSQANLEGGATSADNSSPSGLYVAGASTSMTGVMVKGRIVLAATGGPLVLAWSQFASTASSTTLEAGTHMTCRRVA